MLIDAIIRIMKPRALYILTILAALSLNNWLLGLAFNRHLLFRGGAISEFSALDQPHHIVFRSLDVVGGALLIILAVILAKAMVRASGYYILIFSTVALGLANMADALQPLKCSETLTASCWIPVKVSLSHLTIPSHGYSSVVIGVCYLALPVGGWIYANHIKSKALKITSIILSAIAVAYLLAAVAEYLITGAFSDKAWGPSQEIQTLLLGGWFIVWYRSTRKEPI